MISIAYTPKDIDPTEKQHEANDCFAKKYGGCNHLMAHINREYIENIGSWAKAERLVKKLIEVGHYDIFIDKHDRDNDLIDYKGFNQKT